MNKRFRIAIAAATMVGGFTITQAGSASAAHCFEGNTPGFSYFGTDHVKEARHTNEGSTRPHAGRIERPKRRTEQHRPLHAGPRPAALGFAPPRVAFMNDARPHSGRASFACLVPIAYEECRY